MTKENLAKQIIETDNNTNSQPKTNVGHSLATNVERLCDGGKIEAEKLNLLLMFNQGTNVEFCTSAPLLQNRCYLPFICQL